MNISEYKIKEKLQELKNIEGHGTELVSVYLAGEQPVHETVGRHEFITFADTLGIPVIFISEGTQEGRQFILALHGLGAYVKYAKHKG